MLKTLIAIIGLILAIAAPQSADALPFDETGAGRTLATANVFSGDIDVSRIDGRIRRNGVDMFQVFIDDTSAFFARVLNFGGADTQLFLFDENGFGVAANDDRNNTDSLSRLSGFAGASDLYYLAISGAGVDPVSASGKIFPDTPINAMVGATGAGAAQALSGWTGTTGATNRGQYQIRVRGAFTSDYTTAVAEPATVGLLGLALVGIGGLRRRTSA